MNFSLVYLGQLFFYRIADFFRDWFWGSFRVIARYTFNVLENLDQGFAWRITLRNIFEPLYQDHTVLGHILGFILRFGRLFFGTVVYAFIIMIAAFLYLSWIMIPIYVLYKGFF